MSDPYQVLGLEPGAGAEAVKRAYRRRVRETHPDRNPDPRAAAEFAAVQQAYAQLSDVLEAAEPTPSVRDAPFIAGMNVFTEVQLSFGVAMGGAEITIEAHLQEVCSSCEGVGCAQCDSGRILRPRSFRAAIPPGVRDGTALRLQGRGHAGLGGAASGDMYVTVHVGPSRVWRDVQEGLEVDVPISLTEAIFGADITVPALQGTRSLRIPPGAQPGMRLRLRGAGPRGRQSEHSDLIYRLLIHVPKPEQIPDPEVLRDRLGPAVDRDSLLRRALQDFQD